MHCSSHQGWRRYFISSNLTLSLLVALITATGLVSSKIIEQLKLDDADVFAVASRYENVSGESTLELAIGNKGSFSAIYSSSIVFYNHTDKGNCALRLKLSDFDQITIIEPGNEIRLQLEPDEITNEFNKFPSLADGPKLHIYFISLVGTQGEYDATKYSPSRLKVKSFVDDNIHHCL